MRKNSLLNKNISSLSLFSKLQLVANIITGAFRTYEIKLQNKILRKKRRKRIEKPKPIVMNEQNEIF